MSQRFVHIMILLFVVLLSAFPRFATAQDNYTNIISSQLPAGISMEQAKQMLDNAGISADQAGAFLSKKTDLSNAASSDTKHAKLPSATPHKTALRHAKAPVSAIERLYRSQYASFRAAGLRQYGYDIFKNSMASVTQLAVPDDNYLLGPGDQLRIRIWGNSVDAEYTGTIGKDGAMDVPKVGVVSLSGVPFGKAEQVIRREAEKYVQGINIRVSMARLRSIEVYVVGEVRQPGLHLVPAFSTVMNGLTAAGGVKKSGSLRTIRLTEKDGGKKTIDLYTLLLHGSRNNDYPLKNGSVIFVPRLKLTAAVAGGVVHPGIYELAGENTVADLLKLAGGPLPQSFTGKMALRRFVDHDKFVILDIDSTVNAGEADKIAIQAGDLLELRMVDNAMPPVVTLEGNVRQKDTFDYHPGLSLADILTGPELLKPESILDFALLKRYDSKSTRFEVQQFPLDQVLAGKYNEKLRPLDRIIILSRQEYKIEEPISIAGAVWQPGRYQMSPGLTLSGIVSLAGGYKFDADRQRIDLSRQHIEHGVATTVNRQLSASHDGDFKLQAYDYINVRMIKDATRFRTVTLSGEVKYPGTYRIHDGEKLSDIITRAGGFTDKSYFYGAVFTSKRAREIQQRSINKMVDEVELKSQSVLADQAKTATNAEDTKIARQTIKGFIDRLRHIQASGRVAINLAPLESLRKSPFDFELHDGDALFVPKVTNFVSVLGSVYNPNSFLYDGRLRVTDYLKMAGGLTKNADKKSLYILKANGRVLAAAQSGWFDSFGHARLMPGDSIIAPEDMDRIPYLKLIGAVSDIVFKIATTAGIVLAI